MKGPQSGRSNRQKTMKITAYLKPHCGWSGGVRAVLKKYQSEYQDRDINNNPEVYAEMVEKSGQTLSPCVDVDGVMLADISGEELESYLLSNKLVVASEVSSDVPLNAPCTDEEHARMAGQSIQFL